MKILIKFMALLGLILSQTGAIAQLDFVKKIQDGLDSKLMSEKQTNRKDAFNFDSQNIVNAPQSAASSPTGSAKQKSKEKISTLTLEK